MLVGRGQASFRSMYPFELFVRFQIVDCLSTRQIVHCLSKPCVISMKMCIDGGEPALAETSDFKAKPPAGIDPIGASSEGASLYELIREDIIEGRLAANERLVVDRSRPASRHLDQPRARSSAAVARGRLCHFRSQPRGARPAHRSGFRSGYLRDRCSDRAGPDSMVCEYGYRRGHRRTRTSPRPDRREQLRRHIQAQRTGYRLPHRDVPAALQPPCSRALVEASRSAASREPAFQFHAGSACRDHARAPRTHRAT